MQNRNPHHYEYWIHSLDEGGIPAEIPRKYAIELACDYLAACRTYGGNPREEINWWNKFSPKIKMHENTKTYLSNLFGGFYDGKSLKDSVKFADVLSKYNLKRQD